VLSSFGVPEWLYIVIILAVSLLVAKLIHFILETYMKKLTEKTKTDIDDKILQVLIKPIYILTLLAGLQLSLSSVSYIRGYEGIVSHIFFLLYVLIISKAVADIFKIFVFKWLSVSKRFKKTPQLINRIVSAFVYLIAILVVLDYFHISITPLIATLGIGGLAIGLALQSTLSNFFAGIYVISDKYINVGDFIEMGDISGWVEDISWRSTRIRTLGNDIYVIPNDKLANSIVKNTSEPVSSVTVAVNCGVAYGSNLEKVEKVTLKTAKQVIKTSDVADKNAEPSMFFTDFGDSNINFVVYLKAVEASKKKKLAHEFIKALNKAFEKERIEISWPVVKVYKAK